MDLQRLRAETQHEHEATEAAMPLMEPGLTLGSYKSVLRTLLPILESWETWSAKYAPLTLKPLLAARRRSHLLKEDLRSLGDPTPGTSGMPQGAPTIDWIGVTTPRHSGSTELEQGDPIAYQAAFLGALYVLEGSTLGGRMIARHLEPAFGFRDGQGDSYFRGHGDQTGAMWRETTAAIAALPGEYNDDVVDAAKRTFNAFRSVLDTLKAPSSATMPSTPSGPSGPSE